MIAELNEEFWKQLLGRMEAQSVIPIVGRGAITFGGTDELLHPWLADKVAAKYNIKLPSKGPKTLQYIADAQWLGGATSEDRMERINVMHLYLFNLLDHSGVHPGITLYRLAGIKDFPVFLTTSFDPLLARAVATAQPAARPSDWVRAISFRDGFRDLPADPRDLPYACVYHLLGKIRKAPDCALRDDDALAFLRALDQHLHAAGHLATALHDSHLLFLGVSLDNWLLRFLVQAAKGKRLVQAAKGKHLSDPERGHLYLSEIAETAERDQVVAFFSRFTSHFYSIPIGPREFIADLAERWRAAHPQSPDDLTLMKQAHRLAHRAPGCIFVSYASSDLLIAEYIVKQLQEKGLLVWFDKQQLQPGQDWKAEFSEAVETTCGVFLSLISDNTAERLVGFNILERNLAIDRQEQFADTAVFYIPVRIDEGEPLIPRSEPRRSMKIQAVRKPGGHLDNDFIEYLRQLQLSYCKSRGIPFSPPPPAP